MARRLEITLSDAAWERLELARGHEPRASFVKRALESALGTGIAHPEGTSVPTRPRAPVEKEPSAEVPLPKIAPRRIR